MGEFIPFFAISAVFGVGAFALWTEHLRKLAKIEAEAAAARDTHQSRDLEERLRVLERIVTDHGYDVARQIEALREPGEVAARTGSVRAKEML
jgi:IS5 family transposase